MIDLPLTLVLLSIESLPGYGAPPLSSLTPIYSNNKCLSVDAKAKKPLSFCTFFANNLIFNIIKILHNFYGSVMIFSELSLFFDSIWKNTQLKGSNVMIVTLRELLSAHIFLNSELLAGEAGLDRNVTSIIIIDGPSGYKYTEPNMLVMTSGYFLSQEDTTTQLDLIKKLAEREVAGIAIKSNYFKNNKIPQHLISQADMLNFPLITLGSDSRFRNFAVFFDTSLYCRGPKSFMKKEDISSMFIKSLSSESLPGLAKQLHHLSGLNVTVLFEQKILSYPTEQTNDSFSQKIAGFSSKNHIKPSQEFPGLLEFRYENAESGQIIFGLGVEFRYKSNSVGSIWIDCSHRIPDENDAILLKSAQFACRIEIKQIINYQQEQARCRMQFIERLLSGQLSSWQEALLLSMGLNWRISSEIQLLAIPYADKSELFFDIESAVREFFRSKSEIIIVYPYQNNILTFLPSSYANPIEVCTKLQTELEKLFPKEHFSIGLGRVVSLKNARLSYEQAKYAAEMGKLINTNQKIHEFQKLGFYRLFCTGMLPDELFRFCDDYIGPLLELDRTTNLDLLTTLRVYFECQENYSRTGKVLFLRPNAVRYRLEVIEKACNINFGNHFDSLNMKLSLYLMPIVSSKLSAAGDTQKNDLDLSHILKYIHKSFQDHNIV
jgi:purine catabolism regulator